MKKEPKIFLDHILECIQLIEEYTKEKTRDEFLKLIWGGRKIDLTAINISTVGTLEDVRLKSWNQRRLTIWTG